MSTQAEGPALGILELGSIARGVKVADAVVKRAPAALLMSQPVPGGKHLVCVAGGVAEVSESMDAGVEIAGGQLLDRLFLAYAHEQLWPMIEHPMSFDDKWADDEEAEAVAIVETATVCATVAAADAACKAAPVKVRDAQLAVGVTGKAYFTMTGALADVEASADAARSTAGERLLMLEVIASPHTDIRGRLIF